MNKLKYALAGMTLLLAACQHSNEIYFEDSTYEEETTVLHENKTEKVEATVLPAPTAKEIAEAKAQKEEQAKLRAENEAKAKAQKEAEPEVMHPDEPLEKLAYDSAYDRFLDNVVIKARSENFVTYEYKDVRVDELAPIASRYCKDNGNRTAVLRGIVLYKNYARRATFDCLRLQ